MGRNRLELASHRFSFMLSCCVIKVHRESTILPVLGFTSFKVKDLVFAVRVARYQFEELYAMILRHESTVQPSETPYAQLHPGIGCTGSAPSWLPWYPWRWLEGADQSSGLDLGRVETKEHERQI